jgi:hypothetical protein
MATADIKLYDNVGDGVVTVEAGDLNVDGGEKRRNGSTTQYKRALVHYPDDGLIINYKNDYSGGVTIRGMKKIIFFDTGTPFGTGLLALGKGCTVEGDSLLFEALKLLQFSVPVRINGDVTFIGHARFEQAQENWRYCKKCKGLWFAGTTEKSVCPAGGEHSLEGSGSYRLMG